MIKSRYQIVGFVAIALLSMTSPSRASAPAGRYTSPNTATVFDTMTKLTWQKGTSPTTNTWDEAKSYCAAVAAALGGSGWRLPTAKEIQTLFDYSKGSPAIDTSSFPNTQSAGYWTSTPNVSTPTWAWYATFSGGSISVSPPSMGFYVRCVR